MPKHLQKLLSAREAVATSDNGDETIGYCWCCSRMPNPNSQSVVSIGRGSLNSPVKVAIVIIIGHFTGYLQI